MYFVIGTNPAGGPTYIRWGRTTCPEHEGTEFVYQGTSSIMKFTSCVHPEKVNLELNATMWPNLRVIKYFQPYIFFTNYEKIDLTGFVNTIAFRFVCIGLKIIIPPILPFRIWIWGEFWTQGRNFRLLVHSFYSGLGWYFQRCRKLPLLSVWNGVRSSIIWPILTRKCRVYQPAWRTVCSVPSHKPWNTSSDSG